MVHKKGRFWQEFMVLIALPALLTTILVTFILFRTNQVDLSFGQVYGLFALIFIFYIVLATFITIIASGFIKLLGLLFKNQPQSLFLTLSWVETGAVPGAFAAFYCLDRFRHAIYVTRELSPPVVWIVVALLATIVVFFAVSILFHFLLRTRGSRTFLVVGVSSLLALIIIPFILQATISSVPFKQQRETLLSRGPYSTVTPETGPADHNGQVMLFGLDGATWDLLVPLLKMGRCAVIQTLFRQGSAGTLSTIVPTLSPVIWTSIATGMLPENHGIHHFAHFELPLLGTLPAKLHWPAHTLTKQAVKSLEKIGIISSELYTSTSRTAPTFYEILSASGENTGVVNWWCSWPLSPQQGFNISERFSYSVGEAILGPNATRRNEIFPAILEDHYRAMVRTPRELSVSELNQFMSLTEQEIRNIEQNEKKQWFFSNWFWFRTVYQSDASLSEIGFDLFKKYNPRLFCIYLQAIDVVGHHFWHYLEPENFPSLGPDEIEQFRNVIPAVYDHQDKLLGTMIGSGPEKTVLIVSDHGMIPTGRLPKSGDHVIGQPSGIFLGCGPALKPHTIVSGLSVIDIAPLTLYLMGYPFSQDMDGRFPGEMIRAAYLDQNPVQSIPSYRHIRGQMTTDIQSSTDEDLFKKLKGLGYLD